jgi:5,6,7,8-tetrahydromethanopterin hydro-lyase
MQIGEAFVGNGQDAAHVNTVLGRRDGPVGTAWATALATPTTGYARFVVVARPGIAVQPLTLFVNKAAIEGETHARLTWGAAQAGVAGGVGDALRDGRVDPTWLLIAAVWVDPAASDADAVYRNNRAATRTALEAGINGTPTTNDVLAVIDVPQNPFYP